MPDDRPSRQPLRDSAPADLAPRAVGRGRWAALAAVTWVGLAAAAVFIRSGQSDSSASVPGSGELLIILWAGLAAALGNLLERALGSGNAGRSRTTARFGLLLAEGLVLAAWAAAPTLLGGGVSIAALAIGVLTCALGAMAGSAPQGGLWENNQPPSADLRRRVLDRHRELIPEAPKDHAWKRAFDILVAVAGLVVTFPAGLALAFLLWWEDPGPILFVKNSVGLGGRTFRQLKFRTMVRDAEDRTGPIWAAEDDSRILRVGRLLRKTALDELPQLLNILAGDMSVVGPRPQRTVLVAGYLELLPEYALRHAVRPGLSGLAQVAGHYYLTPRQKLRFDRLYVRHASLGFDLKLLAIAFLLVFWLRWRPGWDGRIPRSWLHPRRPRPM